MRARSLIAALAGGRRPRGGRRRRPRQRQELAGRRAAHDLRRAGRRRGHRRHAGARLQPAGGRGRDVRRGRRSAAGIDPRALVAIAAHETMLETYGPSQAIHNAFGLGPGIAFADRARRDRAGRAARWPSSYLPEGRTTLATIGSKWAPIGAANDPAGLNRNWTTRRRRPTTRPWAATRSLPILAADAGGGARLRRHGRAGEPAAGPRRPRPDPVERAPRPAGRHRLGRRRARRAAPRPRTASSSRWRCRSGATAAYDAPPPGRLRRRRLPLRRDHRLGAGRRRGRGRGRHPARRGGRRAGAGHRVLARDRRGRPHRLRPARRRTPRASPTAPPVAAGQPLGAAPGCLRVAWERAGARLDPFPILEATRPSTG